jgi:DNA-binding NarL/FixJ family response regulator
MTQHNVFYCQKPVPPPRWLEAFPFAQIVSAVPIRFPDQGLVLWLHNTLPNALPLAIPNTARVVVLSDEPSDEEGLAALAAGAHGYANAHSLPQVLRAINYVVRNDGLWVGESLLGRVIKGVSQLPKPSVSAASSDRLSGLTEKEREVALHVAKGASNKEIARDLNVSERTIKAHLTTVFEKLGVRDRLQLAVLLR